MQGYYLRQGQDYGRKADSNRLYHTDSMSCVQLSQHDRNLSLLAELERQQWIVCWLCTDTWGWLAGAGEAQLADAVALNAKLQGEVDQLNDTVFSKTFRAPSAWAEREVKYKMDKKAWDSQVGHCLFAYAAEEAYLLLFAEGA